MSWQRSVKHVVALDSFSRAVQSRIEIGALAPEGGRILEVWSVDSFTGLMCQVCQVSGLQILREHTLALHTLPRMVFDAPSSFVIPTPNAAEESATCGT
jgi:hypothetical protein